MKHNKKVENLLFSIEEKNDIRRNQQITDSNGNYIYPSDYVMDSPNKAYSTLSSKIYK